MEADMATKTETQNIQPSTFFLGEDLARWAQLLRKKPFSWNGIGPRSEEGRRVT